MEFNIYYFDCKKASTFGALLNNKMKLGAHPGGFEKLVERDFNKDLDFEFQAFLQRNKPNTTIWSKFINKNFATDPIENISNSFILLIKLPENKPFKFFAIVGGQGHLYIDKLKIEHQFGLKVVLNTIDIDKISTFDSQSLNVNSKQQRIIYAQGNSLQEFQFDENEEIIKLLSGKPTEKKVATRISGADSLHITLPLEFNEIGNKCRFLLKQFKADDYKTKFPFFDSLKALQDNNIIPALDNLILDSINNKTIENFSLSLPSIDDYNDCSNYVYSLDDYEILKYELLIENVCTLVEERSSILSDLSEITVNTFKSNGEKLNSFGFSQIINCEVTYKNSTYLHLNGKWYKVKKDFIDKINSNFDKIEVIQKPNYLPPLIKEPDGNGILKFIDEGKYNDRLDKTFHCIYDKKLFPIPNGRSTIEICDSFNHNEKHFICVKKYNGSATLSHLFAQGSVSVSLLAGHDKYRTHFCKRTNEHFQTKSYTSKKLESELNSYTLVYAIASESQKALSKVIPFFSKVNLLTHEKTIKSLGMKTSLYKIEMQ